MRRIMVGVLLMAAVGVAHGHIADSVRSAAVTQTAAIARECKRIGDFYWEIGDAKDVRGSGAIGDRFNAQTVMPIASASKWVFGAYVLEKIGRHTEPSRAQIQALEMTSGYTGLKYGRCIFQRTVAACFHNRGNDEFVAANVGRFFYNGGHDQKLAIDLGLGDLTAQQFTAEIDKYLGRDLNIDFNSPQPAGGMRANASDYGRFLRRILRGELRMHDYLGFEPVCTDPNSCRTAVSSPVPAAWHYSLNHWVEDGPGDDGAFSSPGAFGFYPWISADRQWYGLLVREQRRRDAGKESVYCGVKLRRAWFSGMAQQ